MCGIIAVVRQPSGRVPPAAAEVLRPLEAAAQVLAEPGTWSQPDRLADAAGLVAEADALLRGVPGVLALIRDRALWRSVETLASGLTDQVAAIEVALDTVLADASLVDQGTGLEAVNAAMVGLKDAVWAIDRDRLRNARAVDQLAGRSPSDAAIAVYTSIQQALSALDRLEVRGQGLGRVVRPGPRPRARPRGTGRGGRSHPARRRPPVRFALGAGSRWPARLRLQGRGRDRRAGGQHAGAAGRHRGRRPAAPGGRGPQRRGGGPGPHPVGQRRHHLPAERPPTELRGAGRRLRSLRDRRAQR